MERSDRDGAVTLLRVVGLAGLIVRVVGLLPGSAGEAGEWSNFVLLGTLLPALVLLGLGRLGRVVGAGLLALGVLTCVELVVRLGDARLVALGLIQWAMLGLVAAWRGGRLERSWREVPRVAAGGLIVMTAWVGASRLMWWASLGDLAMTPRGALTIVIAMGLVALFLNGTVEAGGPRSRRWARLLVVASLVVIGLASLRLDTLGGAASVPSDRYRGIAAFHHWGVIVGPAAMVRQGGWPLWDVPIQYGFLNTLLLAWLPLRSVWQSLYVVNAAALFASAAIVFALLRRARPGLAALPVALALTLAAVFLIPGDAPSLSGPSPFPAVGAYRYLWCYVLLGLAARGGRLGADRRRLATGCGAWLLATLWSSDGAIYATAIWLPTLAVLAIRRAREVGPTDWFGRARIVVGWLALPPALWVLAWSGIAAFYRTRLGRLPDFAAFFDFAAAARMGVAPMRPDGAVLALLTTFCAFAAVAAWLRGRGASVGSLALIAGAAGALWASSSYFVIRSVDPLVTAVCPIGLAGIAAALWLIDRDGRAPTALRAAFAPLLTMVLVLGVHNPAELRRWATALGRGYVADVERRLPAADPALVGLLDRAGVGGGPIAYVEDFPDPLIHNRLHNYLGVRAVAGRGRPEAVHRAWLPIEPLTLYDPLPADRRRVYFARFVDRRRSGGWLVHSRDGNDPFAAWVFEALAETHRPIRVVEEGRWRLVRYEWAGGDPGRLAAGSWAGGVTR